MPEQNALIRAKYPQFRTDLLSTYYAKWSGQVQPAQTVHTIEIDYRLPTTFALNTTTRQYYPRVRVTNPPLELHSDYELGPLPHVWYPGENAEDRRPILCLFAPHRNEWTWDDAISETTIPDACEWLFFYEAWLATHKWYGGGEPHNEDMGKQNAKRTSVRRNALSGTSEDSLARGAGFQYSFD